MNKKTIFLSISTGILTGFIAGVISYPLYQSSVHAQQKEKKKKDPIVRKLQNIEQAISDRQSPVVKELEDITNELSDMNKELEDLNRSVEDIEREWKR